jgi:hypothetical protein
MELSLVALAAAIGLAACLCVYLPLRLLTGRGERLPSRWRFGLFFVAIGRGYFAVEIALLQKFGLFLGHPNYALSVVPAALLVATGLGALLAERLVGIAGQTRFVSYGLGGIILMEYALALPQLPWLVWLGTVARVALVFGLVLPVGLCLGAFLPVGIERLNCPGGTRPDHARRTRCSTCFRPG